ncbi:hypothetical protein [Seonamhaeicola maritimus]|uniref:Uncharacterized protein n=1 Tax=Seonamhaeicola maritimus TaxID=2591822 RepID=A0A5C7GK99_9FLAO|nr:hypothetical protein [Seonamhaeicola maritimus]TXG38724.1 hypothetical protein FUA22_02225 [Seonamhaeicola maritimus]
MQKVYDSNRVRLEKYKDLFKQTNLPLSQIREGLGDLDWSFRGISFESNTIATLQSTGDIKIIPSHIRDKLIRHKKFQIETNLASKTNNANGLELTNYASRLFGGSSLLNRITNQPKLAEYVSEENRLIEIILALEAAYKRKELAENNSLRSFETVLFNIDELTELINKELK